MLSTWERSIWNEGRFTYTAVIEDAWRFMPEKKMELEQQSLQRQPMEQPPQENEQEQQQEQEPETFNKTF